MQYDGCHDFGKPKLDDGKAVLRWLGYGLYRAYIRQAGIAAYRKGRCVCVCVCVCVCDASGIIKWAYTARMYITINSLYS